LNHMDPFSLIDSIQDIRVTIVDERDTRLAAE
jgi:hypothetical protein